MCLLRGFAVAGLDWPLRIPVQRTSKVSVAQFDS